MFNILFKKSFSFYSKVISIVLHLDCISCFLWKIHSSKFILASLGLEIRLHFNYKIEFYPARLRNKLFQSTIFFRFFPKNIKSSSRQD